MERFDVVVIGGGPGGYLCAERAAEAGLKTALIEKKALGGTCLNEGCIPTKAFLYCAKNYKAALHAESYAFTAKDVSFDQNACVDRKNDVVATLVKGVGMSMKAHGVKVYAAAGSITGRTEEGFAVAAGDEALLADRLVIATGSVPAVPPIPGAKEALASGFAVTTHELLDERSIPGNLVIIGGGVIGLEMACFFHTIGSKVTILEALPAMGGKTDKDAMKRLKKAYSKEGMKFFTNARVTEIVADGVLYTDEKGNACKAEADKVLIATGRRPYTQGLNLESLGIAMDRAAILTDEHLCTNVPGVYAIGDCNAKVMLAHTAYREAEVAVHHMTGIEDSMSYDHIPAVIYTTPEIASVGLTEEEAIARGLRVKTVQVPMMVSGRYVAEVLKGDGMAKLVYDEDRKCLVGAVLCGNYASEFICAATLMLDQEMPIEEIKKTVFAHPTVSEVLREGLFAI